LETSANVSHSLNRLRILRKTRTHAIRLNQRNAELRQSAKESGLISMKACTTFMEVRQHVNTVEDYRKQVWVREYQH
jgi:hypothetical protein